MQKIAKKFFEVMKDCSHVAKNGTNDFHRYKYATAADVLEKVNTSLTKHGLASVVATNLLGSKEVTTAKGNVEQLVTVEVSVTLIDAESGEALTLKGLGSGQDAGDKSIAKAQTMAIKYCYLNSFAIATNDDPEADLHTDEVMQPKAKPPSPKNTPKINSANAPLICHDCGSNISQKVADYSKAKFGRFLCYDCQRGGQSVAKTFSSPELLGSGLFLFPEIFPMDNLKELTCNNIRAALEDYFRHVDSEDVYENITEEFVDRLASDAIKAKRPLRELFCHSHGWNENLQAIVINGTKTHNPDYSLVHDLAHLILLPAKLDADCDKISLIERAVCFFSRPNENADYYINAINQLAPQAYAPRKKRSRIFKAICDSLGVTDLSAGSQFQHLFAQFADELSTKKIDFKLFMSINPAHFITMSNPKRDKRGHTMTSCHSFNVIDCDYNCGCAGYARDDVTFIVFTASNPDKPETINNRKTTRQLFMYKPYNGLLLQSRLYNTSGGTCGAQAESKLYRDLVQRELSELEGVPNLWKTEKYCGNKHDIRIACGYGFGGYADWIHPDFDAKISIRQDHANDFEVFKVGTYGLCISCAGELSKGLLCDDCNQNESEFCQECENFCSETWEVINRHGERIHVCEHCLNEYYCLCEHCEEYFDKRQMTIVHDGSYVCSRCLDDEYLLCSECDEYFPADDVSFAVDAHGNDVLVCHDCRDTHYTQCVECERFFHNDSIDDDICHSCKAEEVPA